MSGTITLASSGPNGPGDGGSDFASLSADGTKVVFLSSADNLVAGDTNGRDDIFVTDLATGTVTLVSTGPGGQANGHSFGSSSFFADGTKVAFSSDATSLVAGGRSGVFFKDLATGNLTVVNAGPEYSQYNLGTVSPSLSADGTKVAFSSFGRGNLLEAVSKRFINGPVVVEAR